MSQRGRRWTAWLVVVAGLVLVLAGCAAAANGAVPPAPGQPGFWLGLWQGLILPITFLVSLFDDRVAVYAVPNSGHLYDLGFVLGAWCFSLPGLLFRRPSSRRARSGAGR